MSKIPSFRSALLAGILVFAGCSAASHEPPNLDPLKQQLRAYHDSGDYLRDVAAVATQARSWIEKRAGRRADGEHLAVVFDLDETLLSNWPQLREYDFGFVPPAWAAWIETAKAEPIEPVREVFRTARRLGLEVFFITGRPEKIRAATERNLRATDCGDCDALFCQPEGKGTTGAFKAATRQRLVAEGHVIIANIGDQDSDLTGGFAERTFKLPNPFYLTK